MKILVYPHDLRIGGSQLNAIELGAAVRDLGHHVIVFGQPGPLMHKVRELDLEFVAAPTPRKRPSPSVCRALRQLAHDRGIDVLHGYEWPPALECLLASRVMPGTISVATVMSMAVAPFIPKSMPLLVGTEQILQVEKAYGRRRLGLLEPPVDTFANHAAAIDVPGEFRERFGLTDGALTVVCVSRLARELKLEGILSAMDAVAKLALHKDVRLVVVGDGPGMGQALERAAAINNRLQRSVVVLTGEIPDPRPAYAAADVVVGMGSSALRGMSFGKPLIVQGESGYWELLTAETLGEFLWQGWYGLGKGAATGTQRLVSILGPLLTSKTERERLGAFGRAVVEDRFSLSNAARVQVSFYQNLLHDGGWTSSSFVAETAGALRYAAYVGRRRYNKHFGSNTADDFNAVPVAAQATAAARGRSL
ncbi:glycosyltransferase [Paenarthrobacter sp. NPDC089322]|uniref:glycosyltransferase n=1 Tax=Paenarthrobacter sp. NPDC089322 TaxID=3155065 RepID=UPI003413BFF5